MVTLWIIGLVCVGRGEGVSCCLAKMGRGDGCLCPSLHGSWGILFSAEISAGGSVFLLLQHSAVSSFLFILFDGSKYGFALRKQRRRTFCFWSWGVKLDSWLAEHVKLLSLFYFLFDSWCVPTSQLFPLASMHLCLWAGSLCTPALLSCFSWVGLMILLPVQPFHLA